MSRQDVAKAIERDLRRYRALRRHRDAQSEFNRRLVKLQLFQQQLMRESYDELFADVHHRRVLEFFLKEMYSGLDLTHLGSNMDKAIKLSVKLVTNPSLISGTLEFNAITAELDEMLTAVLFENMEVSEICHDAYYQANRLAGTYQMRRRQIELIRELTVDLDRNSKSRVVHTAFKLAKGPAKLGGLGSLYGTLAQGFEAIRYVKSPESLICLIMDSETKLLEEMFVEENVTVAMK